MPIPASEVLRGACYVTKAIQVRRVLSIEGQQLVYDARGRKPVPENEIWGSRITTTVEKFAAEVEGKVACSFNPDFDAMPN